MDVNIETSWKNKLKEEFEKKYFFKLADFVRNEYLTKTIFPPASLIFNAFNCTPFNEVKVVILGQDPYHDNGQAHGLSFSVLDGVVKPPSLNNIFKELLDDVKKPIPLSGNLSSWTNQGVLLLNSSLTVEAHMAGSHQNKGWETFTDAAIKVLSEEREHIVFMLWGSYALKKTSLIDATRHCILTSVHPSPLSAYRGFLGCKHFSKANSYLKDNNYKEIDW